MYHSLFIHSPTERYLACYKILAIVNKAAINICVQGFVGREFSATLGTYRGVRLLDCMIRVRLVLVNETSKLSSKAAVPFCIPTSHVWECVAPHPQQHWTSSTFWILAILIGVQWYLIVVLIFTPWWHVMWSIFSRACLPSAISSSVRCLLESLVHF